MCMLNATPGNGKRVQVMPVYVEKETKEGTGIHF